ncbi:Uncharacterised protein [Mycobacteroides abscessus subsp. massiliense]|nr:Uncharacterised protein [Mycobacteroides abscessus subsp. massiliense]SKN75685.1 Uncharacterised protein [Mycobacteroides abscessus subsp. massiliense]
MHPFIRGGTIFELEYVIAVDGAGMDRCDAPRAMGQLDVALISDDQLSFVSARLAVPERQ